MTANLFAELSSHKRRFGSALLCFCTVLVLFCAASARGVAQLSTTATITGTVTDETKALVPEAMVTILNEDTKVSTGVTTNGDGAFVAPGLAVGSYSVSIAKAGFQSYAVTGIVLHPAVTATVNGVLKVGSASSTVEVSADLVQVETATTENSASVEAAQISTLPMNGRNYQGLASLMPGVQNTSAGNSLTTGGRSTSNALSVNGLSQNKTFYALDGVWNENTGNMNQTSVIPNPDSLEEVRVLENNYSAKYSLMGASVVLLQTKSGTNHFHGTAWEFLRNDALNSKPYFSSAILPYKQNIFGYNLGGPVFVPKVYNASRQKTFFFFSEQFVILHQGVANLTGITVTDNQRQGIFGSRIDQPGVVDPVTKARVPFPKNAQGQYVIPSAQLNPNSVAFLNALYPRPNFSNGNINYLNSKPQITDQRDDEIKIDHNFNSKFHLLGEYLDEYQKFAQNSLTGSQSGEIFPVNSETDYTHNKLAQLSLTSILTPNMVNTTNIAMNIFDLDLNLTGTAFTNQIPGFQESLPYNGFLSNRIPLVTFSGGLAPQGIAAARPLTHAADLDDTVGDDWSWLHGRHYLQAGFSLVFNTKRQNVATATNGQFTFTGASTAPLSGGVTQDDAIADFLLGKAATFTQVSGQPRVAVHGAEFSPYIEDRIKITKDLTFTAGVRLYHAPLPYGPPQSETNFFPGSYSLAAAPLVAPNGTITPTAAYNPLNGLITNGTGSVPTNFSNNHVWYVGPLAGFAWDVRGDGKMSIRGGYGLTYTRVFTNQDCSFSCGGNPPAFQSTNLQNASFPNVTGSGTARAATIATLSAADKNIQQTQVHSYSLSMQREFAHNWIGSIAGAGTVAHHVVNTLNYNQPLPYQSYDFNPAINAGTTSQYYYNPTTGDQYSPYPGYGAINTLESGQNQNWHAFEASVRHPVSTNLFLTLAYTFSKDLADNPLDPYHPYKYYGPVAGLNFPHSFAGTAIYSLPGQHLKGLEGLAIGGWKLSDITTIRSGTSVSPGLSIARQGIAVRPDRVSNASLVGAKTKAQWFNTGAFAQPAAGFYGNAGTGIIQGPGLIVFDMAMYKDLHITESNYFEFRAEAFNVFNHTNFSGLSTNFGSTTFGQVTSATDPRVLEMALRYHF
ncbi:MAG: hypothetical protein NVSMB62_12160 [Acidobacteriaceae bacterium]